jgi:hypothetical protein
MLITENRLDAWVRSNQQIAQRAIVELVARLVAVSAPKPRKRWFPLGDSIGQPGPDGELDTEFGQAPHVPDGRSYWQIGTATNPAAKAASDYDALTSGPNTAISADIRAQSTFVFVTPLSGARGWTHRRRSAWVDDRKARREWRDVRAFDGTSVVDWLRSYPAVELWMAEKMGFSGDDIETPKQRWGELQTIGDPPPLPAGLFLANREGASVKLRAVLARDCLRLRLDSRYPRQAADYVSAYISTLDATERQEVEGRCLIVRSERAWRQLTSLRDHQSLLLADFDLEDSDTSGARILELAKQGGHSVVYSGPPGGPDHPNRVALPSPKPQQVEETLEVAGYKHERARSLAQRAGGDLGALLRLIQDLSALPGWAQGTAAAELAIASLLGGWREESAADRAVVEALSGNSYGEWIGKMREVALAPATPLIQRDGTWKFTARFEGWHALGPRLSNEHLDRLRASFLTVFKEDDPALELSPDERFAAGLGGKRLAHSEPLRSGLGDAIALLGSYPKALSSCSTGKAEAVAALAVREALSGANWVRWASLNYILPLLAEAAPTEFLGAVDAALGQDPCPLEELFAQESSGIMGANYLSGLLWALETLAWEPAHLPRVATLLGELAARDPGGKWSNRPANSLRMILLPWLPQTCANTAIRLAAVEAVLGQAPGVGWRLLLDLLPEQHSIATPSRRPAWRQSIPDEWRDKPTVREYHQQIELYAILAIDAAAGNLARLADLVERMNSLPPLQRERLFLSLESDALVALPEPERLPLWNVLVDTVTRHKRFTDAQWAMSPETVRRLEAIAERIAPQAPELRHRRLFSDRDFELFDDSENYQERYAALVRSRQEAVAEIHAVRGFDAVAELAALVESPSVLGMAYGAVAPSEVDRGILPNLIGPHRRQIQQFAGGFVLGRFRQQGWSWVDGVDTTGWKPDEIGQFCAFLPFTAEVWARVARLLGSDDGAYWTRTSANPYESTDDLDTAVERLTTHGRPHAAIRCIHKLLLDKQPIDTASAIIALKAGVTSNEPPNAMDTHATLAIIRALQQDQNVNRDDLSIIEWRYLTVLDDREDARPRTLEKMLAEDPAFYCSMVRLAFKSRDESNGCNAPDDAARRLAEQSYRLLSNWQSPPGRSPDGSYDGAKLTEWLGAVTKECRRTGHLETAMTMAGRVLVHVPADPTGLWIHRAAASALDSRGATDLREGFIVEILNSRGVHWVDPTGKPELELAERYSRRADDLDQAGFVRFASAIRKLADSYRREAEQVIREHSEED